MNVLQRVYSHHFYNRYHCCFISVTFSVVSVPQTRCETRCQHGEASKRSDEEGDAAKGDEHQEPPEDLQGAGEGEQGSSFTKLY